MCTLRDSHSPPVVCPHQNFCFWHSRLQKCTYRRGEREMWALTWAWVCSAGRDVGSRARSSWTLVSRRLASAMLWRKRGSTLQTIEMLVTEDEQIRIYNLDMTMNRTQEKGFLLNEGNKCLQKVSLKYFRTWEKISSNKCWKQRILRKIYSETYCKQNIIKSFQKENTSKRKILVLMSLFKTGKTLSRK